MRVFASVLVLIFCFQSLTKAADIKDFEIDGMSIGDSLLDYFSEDEINNATKNNYSGSDKFYGISFYTNKSDRFEAYSFGLKKNDNNYIIYDLGGMKEFPNNLKSCNSLKDTIVESFKSEAKNFEYLEYEYVYETLGNGKSISYVSSFKSPSGSIRIYCTNWEELLEKDNYHDDLSVDISTKEFLDFLTYEAYK